MPEDNCFRFDDNQGVAPCWPDSAEKNPKHSISHSQPGAVIFPLEDVQLLAQCKDLKTKVVTRAKEKLNHVRRLAENEIIGLDLYHKDQSQWSP